MHGAAGDDVVEPMSSQFSATPPRLPRAELPTNEAQAASVSGCISKEERPGTTTVSKDR